MNESAGMGNAPLTKLLLTALDPFKVISATLDAASVDEDVVNNAASIGKVTLAQYNVQSSYGNHQNSDSQSASSRRITYEPTETTNA